jgi:hypothetical protein
MLPSVLGGHSGIQQTVKQIQWQYDCEGSNRIAVQKL